MTLTAEEVPTANHMHAIVWHCVVILSRERVGDVC
jgi:hypothetical protein